MNKSSGHEWYFLPKRFKRRRRKVRGQALYKESPPRTMADATTQEEDAPPRSDTVDANDGPEIPDGCRDSLFSCGDPLARALALHNNPPHECPHCRGSADQPCKENPNSLHVSVASMEEYEWLRRLFANDFIISSPHACFMPVPVLSLFSTPFTSVRQENLYNSE